MEVTDDLQCGGLRIIQDADSFKFGTDAVLLADFAKNCHAENALDLCCGNGIVPLLLAAKTKIKNISGLEIQQKSALLAKRSVKLNNLDERIVITEGDLKNSDEIYGKRIFDMITCNPPYMKTGSANLNECDSKSIARHEICCNLEDVIFAASKLLNLNGRFFMVHRPNRLAESIACMKKYKIEPKRLRMVHPDLQREPVLFLIEGLIFGGEELRVMPPLFLKSENGGESEELKKIYGRESI